MRETFNLLLEPYSLLGVKRAKEGYEEIANKRPDIDNKVSYNMGRYYQAIGEDDQALEVFDGLKEMVDFREQTPILVNMGHIYKKQGMIARAEDSYKEALKSFELIYKRLKNSKKRPLIYNNNQNNIGKIFMERKKIYSLADHEINCDNLNLNQISNKIIKLYEEI